MALHPERQGLEAAQSQEAVEGAGDAADGVLQVCDSLAELAGLAGHGNAADHIGMTI